MGVSMYEAVTICIALVTLWSTVTYGNGCNCAPFHLQDRFCNNDFVIKVKVIGKVLIYQEFGRGYRSASNKVYNVIVKTKFKVSPEYENITHWNISTIPMKRACGVNLKRRRHYLIAGNLHQGKPFITICNFIAEWKNVSSFQRRGIKGMYKKHCDCQIYRCQQHSECKKSSKQEADRCYWNTWSKHPNDCFSSHSVCYRRKGVCRWKGGKKFKACLKENNFLGLKNSKGKLRSKPSRKRLRKLESKRKREKTY